MSGFKYNSVIDIDNFNNSHTLAFHFAVGFGGRRLEILEVGCSAGYFGAALKSFGHIVVGVESDKASAEKAATLLDEVYCGFIEDFFEANPHRRFDVITFGDVLEYLVDPEEVLCLAKKHLANDGRIVISIPNIAHGSMRAMLLNGDWEYGELGILDKTHLRFFTKKSLIALLHRNGFKINALQSVRLGIDAAAAMCGVSLEDGPVQIVGDAVDDDTLLDFQYVISATVGVDDFDRTERLGKKNPLKLVALSDNPSSSLTKIRLQLPLRHLAWEEGWNIQFKKFEEFTLRDLTWGDIFVIQRGSSKRALQIANLVTGAGKPFVYDIDDLLLDVPDFLSHHTYLIEGRERIKKCISGASLVTVTHERLAHALGLPPDRYAICPNYARPSLNISDRHVERVGGDVLATLVIASSDKVQTDFLTQPLVEVSKKYGNKVRLVLIGPIGPRMKEMGVEGDCYDILPYEEFGRFVGGLEKPIGVIPLDASRFSSCKSAIKYFDYTVAGLPVICSDVPPYNDVIRSGVDGLLVNNTDSEWLAGIDLMIQSTELRSKLLQAAQVKVQDGYTLQHAIKGWRDALARVAPCDGEASRRNAKISARLLFSLTKVKVLLKETNRRRVAKRRSRLRATT